MTMGSVALDLAESVLEVEVVGAVGVDEVNKVNIAADVDVEVEVEQIIKPPVVKAANYMSLLEQFRISSDNNNTNNIGNNIDSHTARGHSPPSRGHHGTNPESGVVIQGLVMEGQGGRGQNKGDGKNHGNGMEGNFDDMLIGGVKLGVGGGTSHGNNSGHSGAGGVSKRKIASAKRPTRPTRPATEDYARPNTSMGTGNGTNATHSHNNHTGNGNNNDAMLNLFGVGSLPPRPSTSLHTPETPLLVQVERVEVKPTFIQPVDRSLPTSRANSAGRSRPQPISVHIQLQTNPSKPNKPPVKASALTQTNNKNTNNTNNGNTKIPKIQKNPNLRLVDPSGFIQPGIGIGTDTDIDTGTHEHLYPVVESAGITLNIKHNSSNNSNNTNTNYQHTLPRLASDDLLNELILPKASTYLDFEREPRPPSPNLKNNNINGHGSGHGHGVTNGTAATIRSKHHALLENTKFIVKNHVA